MEIWSEDRASCLRITFLEIDDEIDLFQGVHLAMTFEDPEIAMKKTQRFRFNPYRIQHFITDLEIIDVTHQGYVMLKAEEDETCELRIECPDSENTLIFKYRFRWKRAVKNMDTFASASGAFELHPRAIPQMIQDIRHLIPFDKIARAPEHRL